MENKKTNPWLKHVKKYREEHPKKKYSVCLVEAAKTYTKIEGGKQ